VKGILTVIIAMATAACAWAAVAADGTLDFYFIDVEGGQSTLIVTPSKQSLLVDTGYAGDRDANRILAAVRDAGLTRIDYLLTTHFHSDHDGGVAALARQIPILTFIDHGDLDRTAAAESQPSWPQYLEEWEAYTAVRRKGRHLEPHPGDRLPLAGLTVTFLSSAAKTITRPLAGAGKPNPACAPAAPAASEPLENPRSTGFFLQFGAFRFVDLGDLTGAPLFALLCPHDLIGHVDLYLVPHHGGADASYPATFAAVTPKAVIVNNGATKGGSAEVFANLRRAPGLHDVWQLHTSKLAGVTNLGDDHIANLDETTSYWIKASARDDGSFSVTNGRTQVSKTFPPSPDTVRR
jgi:competence protein ComEC